MEKYLESYLEVFGKGLEPYGYKRIKGSRYPYLVRVTPSKEVVTYILIKPGMKMMGQRSSFEIVGGSKSIYNLKLDFKSDPRNDNNFVNNTRVYWSVKEEQQVENDAPDVFYKNRLGTKETPIYASIPDTMYMSLMKKAFEDSKRYLVPELEKIVDVKSMMEFYRKYFGWEMFIRDNFDNIEKKSEDEFYSSSEKICNLILFDCNEFCDYVINNYDTSIKLAQKKYEEDVNTYGGKEGFQEKIERLEKGKKAEIEAFKKYKTQPEYVYLVEKEINKRKEENLSYLRKLGVEI